MEIRLKVIYAPWLALTPWIPVWGNFSSAKIFQGEKTGVFIPQLDTLDELYRADVRVENQRGKITNKGYIKTVGTHGAFDCFYRVLPDDPYCSTIEASELPVGSVLVITHKKVNNITEPEIAVRQKHLSCGLKAYNNALQRSDKSTWTAEEFLSMLQKSSLDLNASLKNHTWIHIIVRRLRALLS